MALPKYWINLSIQGMLKIAFKMCSSADHVFGIQILTFSSLIVEIII